MELQNAEIYGAHFALLKLGELKLPVETSLNLALLTLKLDEPFQVINNVRVKLIKQYGVEKDGEIKVDNAPAKDQAKFMDEFNDLMARTSVINYDGKIKLPKDREIEPNTLVALTKFVEV